MFFLLMLVFLSNMTYCSEQIRDIRLQGHEECIIGYIDSADSCFKPFNRTICKPIELSQIELKEMLNSSTNYFQGTIKKNVQPNCLIALSPCKDFSVIAQLFNKTNLDDNQKKYVSEILKAAEKLQLMIRKCIKLELGKDIMPVLSDFITKSYKTEILDEKEKLKNIKDQLDNFLSTFNGICTKYYNNAYEKTQIHPKIDVFFGLLLALCLYCMQTKNLHFMAQNHTLEKIILIGAYALFLMYDFKDRTALYVAYKYYEMKYEALIHPYANKGYLFFKFGN